jgi:hypothetical protein
VVARCGARSMSGDPDLAPLSLCCHGAAGRAVQPTGVIPRPDLRRPAPALSIAGGANVQHVRQRVSAKGGPCRRWQPRPARWRPLGGLR